MLKDAAAQTGREEKLRVLGVAEIVADTLTGREAPRGAARTLQSGWSVRRGDHLHQWRGSPPERAG